MRRSPIVLAAVVALALATVASAAVAPVFTRSVARPGDRVAVVQPVRGDLPMRGIVIYLIPLSRAPKGVSDGPPPPSLAHHRLGELLGRLWFRVPLVAPGAYTTLVWCRPCGGKDYPHGSVFAGGFLAPNGVLHVRR